MRPYQETELVPGRDLQCQSPLPGPAMALPPSFLVPFPSSGLQQAGEGHAGQTPASPKIRQSPVPMRSRPSDSRAPSNPLGAKVKLYCRLPLRCCGCHLAAFCGHGCAPEPVLQPAGPSLWCPGPSSPFSGLICLSATVDYPKADGVNLSRVRRPAKKGPADFKARAPGGPVVRRLADCPQANPQVKSVVSNLSRGLTDALLVPSLLLTPQHVCDLRLLGPHSRPALSGSLAPCSGSPPLHACAPPRSRDWPQLPSRRAHSGSAVGTAPACTCHGTRTSSCMRGHPNVAEGQQEEKEHVTKSMARLCPRCQTERAKTTEKPGAGAPHSVWKSQGKVWGDAPSATAWKAAERCFPGREGHRSVSSPSLSLSPPLQSGLGPEMPVVTASESPTQ